jgi:hypothetical protein
MFLSLGTGYYDQSGTSDALAVPGSLGRSESSLSPQTKEDLPPRLRNLALSTITGKLWQTTPNTQLDGTSNCSRQWNTFHQNILGGPHYRHRARYMRLDPDLGFPVPKLDAVNELPAIQQAVAAHSKLQNHARIKEVAHRLVASTFFFEKFDSTTGEKEDGKWECDGMTSSIDKFLDANISGSICCRFSTGSEEMRALGRYIHECMSRDFEPFFVIQEDKNFDNAIKIPISEEVLRGMCVRGRFKMATVHLSVSKQMSTTTIYLCLQSAPYNVRSSAGSTLPISGFPRTLMTETLTPSKSSPF